MRFTSAGGALRARLVQLNARDPDNAVARAAEFRELRAHLGRAARRARRSGASDHHALRTLLREAWLHAVLP